MFLYDKVRGFGGFLGGKVRGLKVKLSDNLLKRGLQSINLYIFGGGHVGREIH